MSFIQIASWNIEHLSSGSENKQSAYALADHIALAAVEILATHEIYETDGEGWRASRHVRSGRCLRCLARTLGPRMAPRCRLLAGASATKARPANSVASCGTRAAPKSATDVRAPWECPIKKAGIGFGIALAAHAVKFRTMLKRWRHRTVRGIGSRVRKRVVSS